MAELHYSSPLVTLSDPGPARRIGLRLRPPFPAYLAGLPVPLVPNRVAAMGGTRILWLGPDEWLAILRRDFDVAVCKLPLHRVIAAAFELSWSPDPFDRLIVAQTIAGGGKLITKDRRIHKNFDRAIW